MDIKKIVESIAAKKRIGGVSIAPVCLKLPSLSLRFLFQQEGYPLGKIVHLVGEEASFKTTFSAEIVRWHVVHGGVGVSLHTEGRPNTDILDGVLGEFKDKHTLEVCDNLEEWESYLIEFAKHLESKDTNPVPFCAVIDSVLGSAASSFITDVEKSGFASSRFATEARLIADFLRVFTRKIVKLPMTICLINHRKLRPSGLPYGPPIKTSLGGNEIRYYTSFELELRKSLESDSIGDTTTYEVTITTCKNTYGRPDISLKVPVILSGNPPEVKFDWHAATAKMLQAFSNVKPVPTRSVLNRIQEICRVEVRRAGPYGDRFYCEQIGIKSENAVPGTEFGMVLEEHPNILRELYPLLGIARRYIYNEKLSWEENLNAASEFELTNNSTTDKE
ncbi:MAG: hypothetical protein KatS3mg087_0024 [Patescibacteria group bacterium]|nr:MAG: hypothetical protein KatS3mg087_0024 [Patescibacteria group bacterium]